MVESWQGIVQELYKEANQVTWDNSFYNQSTSLFHTGHKRKTLSSVAMPKKYVVKSTLYFQKY